MTPPTDRGARYYVDPGDDDRRRRSKPVDPNAIDLFRTPEPPREKPAHVPHQPSSATSREAARRVEPVFAGNRLTCFRAIASGENVTRKSIADAYFEGKQNYVTGPVAVLIEEGFVYEEPARDRWGAIVRNDKSQVVPRRVDGSAVLLLTNKGKARAAA